MDPLNIFFGGGDSYFLSWADILCLRLMKSSIIKKLRIFTYQWTTKLYNVAYYLHTSGDIAPLWPPQNNARRFRNNPTPPPHHGTLNKFIHFMGGSRGLPKA